ncbi:C4 protein [Tomato leaf curl Uganda virus]|nr:C4 protein [Tomato leaf curl Uganda virus]
MGNLICMPSSNSRANSRAQTIVSSIVHTQAVAPVSTPTFRALSPVQTSRHISIRTATPSNGDSFRSMEDLQEAGSNRQMTLTPRHLTQEVSRRLLA